MPPTPEIIVNAKGGSGRPGPAASPAVSIRGAKPVDHAYLDYAKTDCSQFVHPCSSGTAKCFPVKLHKILSDPAHEDIIAWSPHGRSVMILNKKRFVEEIAPKHFTFTKIESFHRQLTGWGFKRMYQPGPDNQSYYHPLCLKGLPGLVKFIKRNGDGCGKTVPNVKDEPDFYKMAITHPLPCVEEKELEAKDIETPSPVQAPMMLTINPYGHAVPMIQQGGYLHTSPYWSTGASFQMTPQYFPQQGMMYPARHGVSPTYYPAPTVMAALQPTMGSWNPFSFA